MKTLFENPETRHVLNGDCLAMQLQQAGVTGPTWIFGECLVEGDLGSGSEAAFWNARKKFLADSCGETESNYEKKIISTANALRQLPLGAEVLLWFEDDLFCQTNLWFLIDWLQVRPDLKLSRVFPIITQTNRWDGFGHHDAGQLRQAGEQAVPLTRADRQLGADLWHAYREKSYETFRALALTQTNGFRYLPEICQAEIDRNRGGETPGFPQQLLHRILASGETDFNALFKSFTQEAGWYGFGDVQIRNLLNALDKTS